MSETALSNGVVEQIRSVLSLRDQRCIDVRPDGKPPSSIVSDVFIAVHSEGWEFSGFVGDGGGFIRNSGRGLHNGICEEYHIHVTVSVKLTQDHKDFWGLAINMPWDRSLSYAVRGVINAVHCQPDVLTMANNQLETGISSPFTEMLYGMRTQAKREQKSEWWGTTSTSKSDRVNPIVGYSQTVHFFGGKRIQGIGNYT